MENVNITCLSLNDVRKFVDLVKKTRSLQKKFFRLKSYDSCKLQVLHDCRESELELDFEVQLLYRKIEDAVNEAQSVLFF